jgi:tRNA 2-thiouridine synthesizing protein E
MPTLETKSKKYLLDDAGFLVDPGQWDEDFAERIAPELGIKGGLTPSHWNVVKYIRDTYLKTGSCPIVHKTCKTYKLHLKDLEMLFPSGYVRGACKLAGVSFLAGGVCAEFTPTAETQIRPSVEERVYRVNVQGFLIDPNEWDENFAACKARELQIQGPLSNKHWEVIKYLRSEFEKKGVIPTFYETCKAVGIDVDEFAELFPSGYHRGAVKIAGLSLASKVHLNAPVESKA